MKHILLLDDDPDDLFLLREAFEEIGVPVELKGFQEFEDLCRYLESGASLPDMVFLDINLPKNTGTECLQQLKENLAYAHLPVIIYTNSDYRPNIDDCFALGATVYMKKSNSFEQLKKNLKKVLTWNLLTAFSLPIADRTLLN